MPANGQRLSAVARRRLLRNAGSAGSTATASSPAPAVEANLSEPVSRKVSSEDNESLSEDDGPETSNQFSTLVEASTVDFSSTKEVEQLTGRSVKIRLSRGQKCVVLGTCILWIKQGSVFIYGAVLAASTALYPIHAPSTHALPSIEAMTATAEFHLESLDDGIEDLPFIGIRNLWAPMGFKQSFASFYVLGHSFEQDSKAPRRLRELNIAPWKTLFADLSGFGPATPPRILVCGRRSSGLSTLVRCIINRLLAKQLASLDCPASTGVTLLDLDTNMPEFVPPGLISLVHVDKPVLGPSFTNVLPKSQSQPGQVLRKHFLGDIDKTDLTAWHLGRVHDLLDLEKNCRPKHTGDPVIVIVPKWFNDIDQNTASKLWNKISPTDIVCLDLSPTSPHLQPWRSLAENGTCRIHQLPVHVHDKISAVREHDLQMQSYFHQEGSRVNRPFWDGTPVLAATHRTATLAYGGDEAEICAIIFLGGHVALEDTYDALHGNLVALVAQIAESLTTKDGERDKDSVDRSNNRAYSGVRRTEEDLPRWQGQAGVQSAGPFLAGNSFCLGLAIVQEIDITNRKISLITEPELHVHEIQEQGFHVALVVPKATADGRFKTDWARRELHMKKSGRHSS